jgi:hypothetical protein
MSSTSCFVSGQQISFLRAALAMPVSKDGLEKAIFNKYN